MHEWTTGAVPAILTGERRKDYRSSSTTRTTLFTLLGGLYDLNVHESQTHLCPPELCDPDREPLAEQVGSLSDLSIVYGHLVPEDLSDELPSISTAWRDFGGGDGPQALLQAGPAQSGGRPAATPRRRYRVRRLARALRAADPLLPARAPPAPPVGSTCLTARSTRPISASSQGS